MHTTRSLTAALLALAALLASLMVVTIAAPAGSGRITCDGRTATIIGTNQGERLVGTRRADVIHGLGGNDVIVGRGGNDRICGGGGNDELRGDAGRDRLFGQGGDDGLDGGVSGDRLVGGPGNDTLLDQDGGRDTLLGGRGIDALDGGPGSDRLLGGASSDVIVGGPGDDTIAGGGGGDPILDGNEGDDIIRGGPGNDTIDGGPDTDDCSQDGGRGSIVNCEGDADLQIDITGPESPALFTDIPYVITVTNNGPNRAIFHMRSDGLSAVGGGIGCTDQSFDGLGSQELDDGEAREYVFVTRCMIDTPGLPNTADLFFEVINDSGDDPDTTNNFDEIFVTLAS